MNSSLLATAGLPERIPVVVLAPDPISREGAISQLRQQSAVELVDEADIRVGNVAVLLTEAVDEATLARSRRLVRSDGLHAVLVVNPIGEMELLDVIACGVGAVVWRREATGSRLLQAVQAAHRGDADLPFDLLGRLVGQVRLLRSGAVGGPGGQLAGLTSREIDVLRLVAEGMDTEEVAAKLAYSERTVKNVLHGMTARLGLRNRVHAVVYALREGYIS